MILNVIDDMNNFMKPIRNWIVKNYGNPLFWVGIILVILAIFWIAYSIVHERD